MKKIFQIFGLIILIQLNSNAQVIYDKFEKKDNSIKGSIIFKNQVDSLKLNKNQSEISLLYLTSDFPYPLPASDLINIHIYWDSRFEVNNSIINIYDIKGYKIENSENIKIIKYSSQDGLLQWNTTTNNSGIYFITMEFNQTKKVFTVLVSK